VIQIEALAQAGVIAMLADGRYQGKLALFGGVEKVRFRRIVRPGDELRLVVEVERLSARGGWAQGRASVDDETACEARMFFAVG
jgi:3-hydroxyacyl-[acyl-carrier-protein] dehydratase